MQIPMVERIRNWRPRTPFYYGWLVIFTGAFGNFVSTSVAGVVLGGIQGLITRDTGWSRITIGATATVGVWMTGVTAPIAGRLTDRYGARWLMPMGTLFMGLCLYSLGSATRLWQFVVLAVLGRAISQPLLIGVVPRTLAVNFFLRRRNTALALIGMFRPVGASINIQVISTIADFQGWRAAFRYLGLFSLVLTLPMALVVRRRPEDIGLLPDGDRTQSVPVARDTASTGPAPSQASEPDWTASEAWRTKAYWIVGVCAFLGSSTNAAVGFNIVPHLVETAQLTTTQAAGVLSLGTFLSLSNLGWGYLADRFTPRVCLVWAMTLAAGSVLYLHTVDSLVSAYVFGVLWGVTSGTSGVLISMVIAQFFGRNSYGAIAGTFRPFEAGGLGVGQILGPVIYNVFGSYKWMFICVLLGHILASVLALACRTPRPPARTQAVCG